MPHEPAQASDVVELEGLPRAGEVIAGKYQLEKVIGAGGMGVVVYARHLLLNQPVAVKFLHPQAAVRSDPRARFIREAQAAAALRSEHVARVMDVGQLPSGDPFMVMEYLEGNPLSRIIRKRAPLPVAEAVEYMLQACDAIGEAHTHSIVHRDLKPGNLFITQRPNGTPLLKVLDFGISKSVGEEAGVSELTATNMVMGSPQYASPEQLRSSKNVDTRTDIWSLGVILYYMLTGRRPFDGETMSALCLAIGVEKPVPMTSLRQDLPAGLEQIVMQCLEKDREKRTQTVAELVAQLRPFAPQGMPLLPPVSAPTNPAALMLAGMGDVASQPSLISHATTEPHPPTLMTRGVWTAPSPPRRQTLAIQLSAVAAALILVFVAVYFSRRGDPSPSGHPEVVEAVPQSVVTTASPQATPTTPPTTPGPQEGVITSDFPIAPALANPPPSAQSTNGSSTKPNGNGLGSANRAIVLLDEKGTPVGRVPSGGKVKVLREARGWSLVVWISQSGTAVGWAPSSAITSEQ